MTEFLDYFALQPVEILKAFKAAGARGVVPYLDPYNPKGVTRAALADIFAAGLEIPGFFFETTGGANQGESYFTRAQGVADCLAAEALLAQLGDLAPPTARVWYAADVNIEPSAFDEYANGIESVATPRQTPGIYGFQRLMEHAFEHYPHMGKHLAQTYGIPTVPLELWQHEQVAIAGVAVDLDELSVAGWRPEGADDMTGDTVKDLIREMLKSDEGAVLVEAAVLHPGGYGQALEVELEALRKQAAAAGAPIDEAKILRDATANIIAKLSA